MGRFAVAALFTTSTAVVVVACGGGAGPTIDTPAVEDDAGAAVMFADAGSLCKTDADCPAGFACIVIRIGEISQPSCVPKGNDDASSSTDSAPSDAGTSDAAAGDTGAPKDDSGGGVRDAGGPGDCSKELSVTLTSIAPAPKTCVLNTTVEKSSPAALSYPCSGGAASVTFGTQTFSGTETGGSVTVQNLDTYVLTAVGVPCRYDSTQTISGTLASGVLQYTYSEVLAPGQSSLCPLLFEPCSATGTVTVQ